MLTCQLKFPPFEVDTNFVRTDCVWCQGQVLGPAEKRKFQQDLIVQWLEQWILKSKIWRKKIPSNFYAFLFQKAFLNWKSQTRLFELSSVFCILKKTSGYKSKILTSDQQHQVMSSFNMKPQWKVPHIKI